MTIAFGLNETMGDSVQVAQSNTPVITGNLRRSIKIQETARPLSLVNSASSGS